VQSHPASSRRHHLPFRAALCGGSPFSPIVSYHKRRLPALYSPLFWRARLKVPRAPPLLVRALFSDFPDLRPVSRRFPLLIEVQDLQFNSSHVALSFFFFSCGARDLCWPGITPLPVLPFRERYLIRRRCRLISRLSPSVLLEVCRPRSSRLSLFFRGSSARLLSVLISVFFLRCCAYAISICHPLLTLSWTTFFLSQDGFSLWRLLLDRLGVSPRKWWLGS